MQSLQKKKKKYLEKTLKTWKNYGKIMEFCGSAPVGTLDVAWVPDRFQVFGCRFLSFESFLTYILYKFSDDLKAFSRGRIAS